MREEVRKFMEAYRDSVSHGPSAIADFYSEPCVTASMGVVRVNPTRNDTALLFAEVDARYRPRGFTHGRCPNSWGWSAASVPMRYNFALERPAGNRVAHGAC